MGKMMTQTAPAGAGVGISPFIRGAKPRIEPGSSYSVTAPQFSAGTGRITNKLPTNGWLRGFVAQINATGGSGTATVAAYEDAPWAAIANLNFTDPAGNSYANINGYEWYLAMKYGAYRLFGFDGSTYGLTNVVTGANASGNFMFYIPFYTEFATDGLGCLNNQDTSSQYNTNINIASGVASATGPVYTTAPTNLPAIAVNFWNLERSAPLATSPEGLTQAQEPPARGTVQYVTSQTFTVNNGANTILFNRVGNYIRHHILVYRAANGTRASAEGSTVPSTIEFDWDAEQRYIGDVALMRQQAWQLTGFDAPNGVVPFLNAGDPDNINGGEYGDEYLPTTGATKLQLKFTTTAAGTLDVITIDVQPSGNIFGAPSMLLG